MKIAYLFIGALVCPAACAGPLRTAPTSNPAESGPTPSYGVVLARDLTWEQLNPARGDQSPRAADLWGNRKGQGATGYLLRPVDGFRSPPHVHNVSYRAVVIRGLLHNDAPTAKDLWMPSGSFWTQPKGAVHITAAKGSDTLAYIEIDEGPYLVYPPDRAFSSPERPVVVLASEVEWADPKASSGAAVGHQIARLWGNRHDGKQSGVFVRLPAGFVGTVRSHGSSIRAVVIQGSPRHRVPNETSSKTLTPGSYFSSTGHSLHHVASGTEECMLYVRVDGRLEVAPTRPQK